MVSIRSCTVRTRGNRAAYTALENARQVVDQVDRDAVDLEVVVEAGLGTTAGSSSSNSSTSVLRTMS